MAFYVWILVLAVISTATGVRRYDNVGKSHDTPMIQPNAIDTLQSHFDTSMAETYETSLTTLILFQRSSNGSGIGKTTDKLSSLTENLFIKDDRSRRSGLQYFSSDSPPIRIFNRRMRWKRGEWHVEVTAPEEYGCKTTWAPLCQLWPGWWKMVFPESTFDRILAKASSWFGRGVKDFASKSESEQEWLIEREITVMHILRRRERCLLAAGRRSDVAKTIDFGNCHANEREDGFDRHGKGNDLEHTSDDARAGTFEIALRMAEKEMRQKGITDSRHRSTRLIDVFFMNRQDENLCWLADDHSCIDGRRAETCRTSLF